MSFWQTVFEVTSTNEICDEIRLQERFLWNAHHVMLWWHQTNPILESIWELWSKWLTHTVCVCELIINRWHVKKKYPFPTSHFIGSCCSCCVLNLVLGMLVCLANREMANEHVLPIRPSKMKCRNNFFLQLVQTVRPAANFHLHEQTDASVRLSSLFGNHDEFCWP